MNKNWTPCKIMDLITKGEAELKTGPFGTQLHASDYVETGTPVINVRNVGFGSIREDNLEFISEETVQKLKSHLLEAEDIVFGRKGAVERHAFIEKKHVRWFQGSDCLRLRIKSSRIVPRFLSYYFQTEAHKQWMIKQCSHGSTMASLNQDIISRISFSLPPLPTQHKIASILSAYDNLIENNTRRIAILEEMAQTIYQEWFVHFRYPGHKKNKMVESELGMIPEGWKISTFGENALNFDSKRKPLSSLQRAKIQGKYPYYGAAKIFDHIDSYIFDGKYLLIAEDGSVITNQNKPVLQLVAGKFWVNNHTHIIQGKLPISTNFLYLFLSNVEILGYVTGAAQPKITQTNLNRIPVIVPATELLNQFETIVKDIFDSIIKHESQNANLRYTRDLLLPKLISGEIDVETLDIDIPDIPEPEAQQTQATFVQPEPIDASQLAFLF